MMKLAGLLLPLLVACLSACNGNPCEEAHQHVAECLQVTYTKPNDGEECRSPATSPGFVYGQGCHCEGVSACESQCFIDTSCEWLQRAYKGEHVTGLEDCLRKCAAAN